jgi:GTP cyclohydrolase II
MDILLNGAEEQSDGWNDASLVASPGSALGVGRTSAPIHGRLESMGSFPVELTHGTFQFHAFESLPDRSHVVAVSMGDICSEEPLLVRLHSECITSETLGGCDCDCVQQLDKALSQIAEEGRGVLFYLFQEGRGAGYSNKGRDRMAVMNSGNKINTFDAYHAMGLPPDARSYEMLSDLVHLLNISADLRIMTNNPLKLKALQDAGISYVRDELSVPSNPQNAHYLESKKAGGHMITAPGEEVGTIPWEVQTFLPRRFEGAARFTHTATYPLPIRPPEGMLLIPASALEDFKGLVTRASGEESALSLVGEFPLSSGKVLVEFNPSVLEGVGLQKQELSRFIAKHPYWFNDHIYHDSASCRDFVVLEHRTGETEMPLVRVQSESYLQRFPLAAEGRSTSYQRSVQAVVENGNGLVVLYPEDGGGHGFGAAFLQERFIREGLADSKEEAADLIGISQDARDYKALALLVKHHYGEGPVKLVFTAEESEEERLPLLLAIEEAGVVVEGWIDLDEEQEYESSQE